uniref:Uncharacterized protein n=1 Tax=Macrostomum lignano TaxID=282301 RepID=A0A1I8FPU3_9PLAT
MASMEAQLAHLTSWIQQNVQQAAAAAATGQAARGKSRCKWRRQSRADMLPATAASIARFSRTEALAERLRRTRHDPGAAPDMTLKSCAQSCRHCLHSVDQMFTDTLAIVQKPTPVEKICAEIESARPRTGQERLKAYRLESRAIDTRLFELEQLVEELRAGTLKCQQALSRLLSDQQLAGGCGISDSAASGGLDGGAAQSLETERGAASVEEAAAACGGAAESFAIEYFLTQEPIRIDAGYDADGRRPLLAALWMPVHRRWPSTSAGISVAISAAASVASAASAVGGVRRAAAANQRARQSQPPPPRPRPQVAFSDTVKVDDGSQVIKLNWADASEPAAAAATAFGRQIADVWQSQDAAAATSSQIIDRRDRGDVIAARRARQQAEAQRLRERSGARQARQPGGGGRGAGVAAAVDGALPQPQRLRPAPGVGIGNRGSCHSGDATADHAAERFGGAQLERISDTTD